MDITELILEQHAEQRRMFALLDELRDHPDGLAAVWSRLAVLLEVHADAEERFFYPRLLEVGVGAGGADGVDDEVEDAIGDHNDIRDAVTKAQAHEVGSDPWWSAVIEARVANSDHMAEEEREDLADFRRRASLQDRHDIAVEFIVYESQHAMGTTARDKDPQQFVAEHG